MSATGELLIYRIRLVVRGVASIGTLLLYGVAMGLVALLGLDSFRQVGLGAVGPAGAALVNLALLLPTAQALLLGALSATGDRESGLAAMIRARGAGPATLVLTGWLAVSVAGWLSLAAGFGTAAIVIAGNVPVDDLPVFTALIVVTAFAVASAAAVGILIGMLVPTRSHATVAAIAIWFVLAIGVDLVVIGLGVFLRLGEIGVLAALVVDPFTAARTASLLLLDASGGVLGPTGIYLVDRLGREGAVGGLLGVVLIWAAVPLVAAVAAGKWRDGWALAGH